MLPAGKMDELAVRRMETLELPRLQLSMGMATYTIMTPPDDPSNPETACNSVVNTSGAAFAGTGHFRPSSAGVAYRPLPLSPKSGYSASARFMSTRP